MNWKLFDTYLSGHKRTGTGVSIGSLDPYGT